MLRVEAVAESVVKGFVPARYRPDDEEVPIVAQVAVP
jgi:hypothetical protein